MKAPLGGRDAAYVDYSPSRVKDYFQIIGSIVIASPERGGNPEPRAVLLLDCVGARGAS